MRSLLPSDDITDVARLQHIAGLYRPPVAAVLASLSISSIGPTKAGLWLFAVLVCEAWTWFCTRPATTQMLTTWQMIHYIVSGAVTMPAWATLGVLFWYLPDPQSCTIAIALWVGQLLYTQRFVYQSYLAILLGNSVMVGTMIAVPLIHPILFGTERLLFEVGLLLCVGFTISASLAAYQRVRSLAEQNAAIARTAITDELTGLPNRHRFDHVIGAAASVGTPFCVLYMDLDRFKLVNDTLGHQAGDALLRQFSGRLLEVSPPGVTVARLGGDEFAALIEAEEFTVSDAETLCQAILNVVKVPFSLANGQAHVGVSIGVAWAEAGQASAEDIMRRADIALYTMKAAGRAGYRVFSDDLELEVRNRAEIEAALRKTLTSADSFSLAYQPKVDRSGGITGVEALLRWRMDSRPVSPALFVPIAEEAGLIVELGEWVIQEAIEFAKRWQPLSVAINLSPAQLRDDDFATRLLRRIEEANLDPSLLELEVTETTLFESSSYALGALDALRAAGLRVALDDFGTGYSSLRHLHNVAVDRVKIDQSFVAGLGRSIESAAIISAVIQLGHSMGLQITAEGVETAAQRDFLVEAGCDELQGYLFAKPMTEEDFAVLFRASGRSLAA
jgi:diguanylate cyclase (GGDEF)-like protein